MFFVELLLFYYILSVWLDAPESIGTIVEELIPNKAIRALEYLLPSVQLCNQELIFRVEAPRFGRYTEQFWEVLCEFAEHNSELVSVQVLRNSVPLEAPKKLKIALTTNAFLGTETMQQKYYEWFADKSMECAAHCTKLLVMGILLS